MSDTPSRIVPDAAAPEFWFREGCHIAEWWNDADDDAVSVVRARVAPGATTRWHRLAGITERYLVLSGAGRVELGDRPAASVGTGAAVVIPPGVTQRVHNPGTEELVFLAVCTPRFREAAYEDVDED